MMKESRQAKGRLRSKYKTGTGGRRREWESRMAGQSEPAPEITPGALQ